MRNLVVFIARHYFFLLFLLLEILSFYFLVQRNYFQHSSAVSAANWVTGTIYQARSDLTSYLDLKEQNKMLAGQLAQLMNRDSASFMRFNTHVVAVGDTVYKQHYEYMTAEVIDNTVTLQNNYIILNRGRLQGVEKDMGVMCAQGVVGNVLDVSDNFCVVLSLLHKDVKGSLSVALKKDGTFGQLQWDGTDYQEATLTGLPSHSKVAVGDTLITSGLGDAFPKNILVGTVTKFEIKKGDKTYTVNVKLSTDFRKVYHVFIIKNYMRDEVEGLKQKTGING